VTAADGVLPDDTALTVGYEGILTEHYSLAKGGPANIDLCCAPGEVVKGALPNVRCAAAQAREASVSQPETREASVSQPETREASVPEMRDASVSPDAAVPSPGPTAIHCSIWTDNVADITVTAAGYATYQRQLLAYLPDPRCYVETIDARITLYHGEGGT
jgi:hypothetical protein